MRLWRSLLDPAWWALAFVFVALCLPLLVMGARSLQVEELVLVDGRVVQAAGAIRATDDAYSFEMPPDPRGVRQGVRLPKEQVAEIRSVWSMHHYRTVFSDSRAMALLDNSLYMALGAALMALLIGFPVAWVLGRMALPGWRLLAALCLAPAVLPPFFIALGGARSWQAWLIDSFGLGGAALQMVNAAIVFGSVLFPFVVVLVAPALASVPAGPHEAARLLGGKRAAWRHVTLPAIWPSVLGAFVLCFVMALTDFAVPDLLGFMLPAGEPPAHVFSTEIRLQWEKASNMGRAVATAAPLLLVTLGLVVVVLLCLRRSPALTTTSGAVRARIRHMGLRIGSYCLLGVVLWCTLGLPLSGIASWPNKGESSASGTSADQQVVEGSGALFEFGKALDATPGIREQRSRWLQLALATALLAMLVATPLVRAATRRRRWWAFAALLAGAVPLAVPGIVLAIGTILLWTDSPLGAANAGLLRPTLVLVARFLPFALLATWLWLRSARVGREEAAASLGAGPATRALRIWGPLGVRGVLVGGLLVLILALREFEAVMLIEPRIYLARLYEKIHFSRLADEANLLLLYLLYVLVPVLALGLLLTWRGRRRKA